MTGVDIEILAMAVLAAAVLLPAAAMDLRTRRIPNLISLGGAASAFATHLVIGGGAGLLDSVQGAGLLFAMTLPLYVIGWMGAGDVKLLAASGAVVGVSDALAVLAATVIVGAALALGLLAWRGRTGEVLGRMRASLSLSMSSRSPVYVGPQGTASAIELPYAVAIATGTLAVVAHRALAAF